MIAQGIQERADREGLRLDFAQQRAAQALSDESLRGVYLTGPVGRGKTWLLDAYIESVPTQRKQRYHCHAFYAELHRRTHILGSIERGIASLVEGYDVLCFDEFVVHDIGNATLVANVIDSIVDQDIRMVVTSNYRPEELLPDPLFHDRFLPTIDVILQTMMVVVVDGPQDYRQSGHPRSATGFSAGSYSVVSRESPAGTVAVLVGGNRAIRAIAVGENHIRLTFDELCGKPNGHADYLILAERFPRWTIVGVPRLAAANSAAVARFCAVVDVLYDAAVELSIEAEVPFTDLLWGTGDVLDIGRAKSRLSSVAQPSPRSVFTA